MKSKIMKNLFKTFTYIFLAYAAMYSTIWLHELGHSLAYYYFDCKDDIMNLHVPVHFANANPYPVNETKVATLDTWQHFYISLAGIIINLVLALGTWFLLQTKVKKYLLVYFFIIMFLLSNLLEAATYLTIGNICLLGDMLGVQNYNPMLRIPLFILGLLLVYSMIALIITAPKTWQRGMTIFSVVAAVSMSGLRLLFTIS